MGLFQRKVLGEESLLCSILVTFGQSIDATEKTNGFTLPAAWDLFMNKAALLTENKFISEQAMDAVVHLSRFEGGRDLVLNLVRLRERMNEAAQFAENFQLLMENKFPAGISFQNSGINPKDFIDYLVENSKEIYPNFGSTLDDQKFYAILGIFFGTVYKDTDSVRSSEKTFRRYTAFTLGLQWFAEWNIAKEIEN